MVGQSGSSAIHVDQTVGTSGSDGQESQGQTCWSEEAQAASPYCCFYRSVPQASASIPCAISLANINQGVVTISKSLSRNGFDWESYTSNNSPPPLLLVLVFVNTVQEYQLGQVCAPTLQSPFVISESVSVVSAWATADFRRHE